ncbi:hypothetical protein BR93DRAFT_968463 [Coniochaeta sp. PMI_546]|nr:hypothetical protein BR93DRAFT_968463 [Coniochaeta sp. PMI_546]
MTPSQQKCIKGWSFAIAFQPLSQKTLPTDGGTAVNGYPANGDDNYAGLCGFTCGLGTKYCSRFSTYCSTTKQAQYIPSSSPFPPDICQAGTSSDPLYAPICAFTCSYRFCPISRAYDNTSITGYPKAGIADHGMCEYASTHGWCPDICTNYVWSKHHDFFVLGDSYSAGNGAGEELGRGNIYDNDTKCHTTEQSYPKFLSCLVQLDTLQFISCSGAVTYDMSLPNPNDQLPQFKWLQNYYLGSIPNQQIPPNIMGWGTLSIGGNDVGLGDIAYKCLFVAPSICMAA